jgi:tRNA threonylcarbamoyladenosine biosynthesis protein TsaB
MMTLALEFSSAHRSMALCERSSTGGQTQLLGFVADDGSATSRPIPLLDGLLRQTGVKRESIEAILVGLGPGSYTGIRSALALAQGWQLARNVKTAGVSSVEILARQAQQNGWFGEVTIVIDAQRQEFYLATYALSPTGQQVLDPLHLVQVQALQSHAARPNAILIGPEITKWVTSGRILFPAAEALANLAAPVDQWVPAEQLEPIYLREITFVKAPPPRKLPT